MRSTAKPCCASFATWSSIKAISGLVAKRFSGARRHDEQNIPAIHDRPAHRLLVRSKRRKAKGILKDRFECLAFHVYGAANRLYRSCPIPDVVQSSPLRLGLDTDARAIPCL